MSEPTHDRPLTKEIASGEVNEPPTQRNLCAQVVIVAVEAGATIDALAATAIGQIIHRALTTSGSSEPTATEGPFVSQEKEP